MTAASNRFRYKAFISYSHAADGRLAPALQAGLERFAKPWYRRRAFRVFRDKTGLAVTPTLWRAIQRGLESSEYFILLASPSAAASEWVAREVEFWLENRPADRLLIVLTDGQIGWDTASGDFDWTTTDALPQALKGRFGEEPNYLDLRWARANTDLSLRRPRFLDAVAGLAATLRQVPLDDLIGEDVAHYQTTRRLLRAGVLLLLLFSVAAFFAAYQASRASRVAEGVQADLARQLALEQEAAAEQARQVEAAATSRALAASAIGALDQDRELGTLLAIEAARSSDTPEAADALRRALARRVPPVVLRGPGDDTVRGIDFSPDGRRLLAVTRNSSVWIWSVGSPGPPALIPRDSMVDDSSVEASVSFSPDGRFILTFPFLGPGSFREPEGGDPAARLWDAETRRLYRVLRHRYLQSAAFSPDGRLIVTAGFNSPTVVGWDVETGNRVFESNDQQYEVVSVDFSRDGKLFATAGNDDTVRIRRAEDGKSIGELRVPGKTFMTAALVSPDGRRIVTLSSDDPARLWDWQNSPGSPVAELSAHEGTVDYAIFSPDSKLLLTLAADQVARVWDVETGRNVRGLEHEEFVGAAAFSPDSRLIATVSADGLAILWDAASGRRVMDFGRHTWPRTSVVFSPDGTGIATGTSSGEVFVEGCEVCGSTADLLARAGTRVTRTLTDEETKRYLRPSGP